MPFKNHYYRGQELWLKRSGDTMLTGTTIVLGRAPTADLEAATKLYSDQAARPQGSNQQFQYNDSLVFNGSPSLLYDKILHLVSIAPVSSDAVQIGNATLTSVTFGDAPTGDFVSIRPVSGGATYPNILSVKANLGTTPLLQVTRQGQTACTNFSGGELGGSGVGGEAVSLVDACIGGGTENGGTSCLQVRSNGNHSVNINGRNRSTGVPSNALIILQNLTGTAGQGVNIGNGAQSGAGGDISFRWDDIFGFTNNATADVASWVFTGRASQTTTSAAGRFAYRGIKHVLVCSGGAVNKELDLICLNIGASGQTKGRAHSLVVESGTPQFKKMGLALVNGANDDIGPPTSLIVRITGPTGAFNITSIRGGVDATDAPQDGDLVYLWNTTAQNMTITNAAATGTAANRITTSTGADLVTAGIGGVLLWYDSTDARWHDMAFQP